MEELIESLKVALASSYAYQLKAHNYHWNVQGSDFKQYHELFGEIYAEVFGSIDILAEEIRAQGVFVPGSLSRFHELSVIEDESVFPDALTMIRRLLDDSKALMSTVLIAYDLAELAGQHGLSNFLAERQDALKKHIWMLSATLGVQAT